MQDETRIMGSEPQRPLRPGDPAPRFSLPAINRNGLISLDDYRGKSPLFLSILRGCTAHFAAEMSRNWP